MNPWQILLAAVAALGFSATPARANECMTREAAIMQAAGLSESFIAHRELTAAQVAAGAEKIGMTGVPETAAIAHGLLLFRVDMVAVLMVWQIDGECGHAFLPPGLAAAFVEALDGRGA